MAQKKANLSLPEFQGVKPLPNLEEQLFFPVTERRTLSGERRIRTIAFSEDASKDDRLVVVVVRLRCKEGFDLHTMFKPDVHAICSMYHGGQEATIVAARPMGEVFGIDPRDLDWAWTDFIKEISNPGIWENAIYEQAAEVDCFCENKVGHQAPYFKSFCWLYIKDVFTSMKGTVLDAWEWEDVKPFVEEDLRRKLFLYLNPNEAALEAARKERSDRERKEMFLMAFNYPSTMGLGSRSRALLFKRAITAHNPFWKKHSDSGNEERYDALKREAMNEVLEQFSRGDFSIDPSPAFSSWGKDPNTVPAEEFYGPSIRFKSQQKDYDHLDILEKLEVAILARTRVKGYINKDVYSAKRAAEEHGAVLYHLLAEKGIRH